MNLIVFDFDETLGHFSQLYVIVSILKEYFSEKYYKFNKYDLFTLLEMFNEVFRFQIFDILKKLRNINNTKILIYTNNNAENEWVDNIIDYINMTIRYKLFTNTIHAYSIDGVIIEKKRTSHSKTYNDLLRCLNLNKANKILFVDDQHHDIMNDDRVLYYNIEPYIHLFSWNDICDRILFSKYRFIIHDKSNFKIFVRDKLIETDCFYLKSTMFNPDNYNTSQVLKNLIKYNFIKSFTKKYSRFKKNKTQKSITYFL